MINLIYNNFDSWNNRIIELQDILNDNDNVIVGYNNIDSLVKLREELNPNIICLNQILIVFYVILTIH